ncbi:hypothetical protein FrEUN1fDRAFT_4384 [Parafrankia sp. EUN1f]|nr:hypothetical protein FrEUN1fDRAFT_4384 [Parafrankia sp. EUN1f]
MPAIVHIQATLFDRSCGPAHGDIAEERRTIPRRTGKSVVAGGGESDVSRPAWKAVIEAITENPVVVKQNRTAQWPVGGVRR